MRLQFPLTSRVTSSPHLAVFAWSRWTALTTAIDQLISMKQDPEVLVEASESMMRLQRRVELLEEALGEASSPAERRRLRDELLDVHRRVERAVDHEAHGSEGNSGVGTSAADIERPTAPEPTSSPSQASIENSRPPRGFVDAAAVCLLEKPFDFSGRASRSEYWWFVLFLVGHSFVAWMVVPLVVAAGTENAFGLLATLGVLGLWAWLAVAHLAAGVRRLHDVGWPGWLVLISVIPLVGLVWLVVILSKPGEQGPNEYGP